MSTYFCSRRWWIALSYWFLIQRLNHVSEITGSLYVTEKSNLEISKSELQSFDEQAYLTSYQRWLWCRTPNFLFHSRVLISYYLGWTRSSSLQYEQNGRCFQEDQPASSQSPSYSKETSTVYLSMIQYLECWGKSHMTPKLPTKHEAKAQINHLSTPALLLNSTVTQTTHLPKRQQQSNIRLQITMDKPTDITPSQLSFL